MIDAILLWIAFTWVIGVALSILWLIVGTAYAIIQTLRGK